MGSTQTGRDVWQELISSPDLEFTDTAAEWLKYILTAARAASAAHTDTQAILVALQELSVGGQVTIDPLKFAEALAANTAFIEAVATAVASKLGIIPTAGEIARQVGNLNWHGRAD